MDNEKDIRILEEYESDLRNLKRKAKENTRRSSFDEGMINGISVAIKILEDKKQKYINT